VEKFVTITPKTINITGTTGQVYSGKTEIIPEEKYPFKVTGYKLNKGTNLSLDVKESVREGKTIYSVQVASGTEAAGNFYDKVLLNTDSQIKPVITVWVSVRLQKNQETAGQINTSDTTN